NDFVRVMRAPYQPVVTTVDFSVVPSSINNTSRIWTYQFSGNNLTVYFADETLYAQALGLVNPSVNPLGFIENYGEGIIEIDYPSDMFFAVQLTADTALGNVRTEVLSSAAPGLFDFHTAFRKTLTGTEISEKHFVDNGRKLRFSAQDNFIKQITFEFYRDF